MENAFWVIIIAVLFIVYFMGRRLRIMFNSNVKSISASEAREVISKHSDILILDVRTKKEYDTGHIPGAVLLPVHELPARVNELTAHSSKPVLVYCASGGRSPGAVRILLDHHFSQIYHLSSGISAWKYEVETN